MLTAVRHSIRSSALLRVCHRLCAGDLNIRAVLLEPTSNAAEKPVRLKIIDMDDIDEDVPSTEGLCVQDTIASNAPPASTTRKLIEEL